MFIFPNEDHGIAAPAISPALKRAQSIVGTSEGRPELDFYPSPPEAVHALLGVETFQGDIWECACGDGAISKILTEHGYAVMSTDLVDRGYGEAGLDFLQPSNRYAANIVTNPPYKLGEKFIMRALERTTGKVAMLMKLQFLEGQRRRKMFETTPLARVHIFSKRLSMTRNGEAMKNSGMMAFCWMVWEHGHIGDPVIKWL